MHKLFWIAYNQETTLPTLTTDCDIIIVIYTLFDSVPSPSSKGDLWLKFYVGGNRTLDCSGTYSMKGFVRHIGCRNSSQNSCVLRHIRYVTSYCFMRGDFLQFLAFVTYRNKEDDVTSRLPLSDYLKT